MNWRFIVAEARKYSLDYFHLFRKHAGGADAARLITSILINAVHSAKTAEVQSAAVDNLLLYLQTIVRDSDGDFERFRPVVDDAFEQMHQLPDGAFDVVVRSYYPVTRLAAAFLKRVPAAAQGFEPLNRLVARYLGHTYAYWLSEDSRKSVSTGRPPNAAWRRLR
jgi:pyruvate,orthophosphate dikinase